MSKNEQRTYSGSSFKYGHVAEIYSKSGSTTSTYDMYVLLITHLNIYTCQRSCLVVHGRNERFMTQQGTTCAVLAFLLLQYINAVMRAMGVSYTRYSSSLQHEFRRHLRSHSWMAQIFIYTWYITNSSPKADNKDNKPSFPATPF